MSDGLRAADSTPAPGLARPAPPGADRLDRPLQHGRPVRAGRARVLRAFAGQRLGLAGLALIALFTLCCFVGPLVYHTDQVHANIQLTNLPPGPGRPLGTDSNGYDILGRLLVGGQSTLEIGFAVALLATALGMVWGAISGLAGGLADAVMMRVVDIALAIPAIFLLIFLSSVLRPTTGLLILVLSLLSWLGPARLVRGETLSLRTREFVEAVTVMGGRRLRVVARHLIPNAFGVIVVSATFQVADAIILLATLSFLGFGLPPPAATWGGMLSQGTTYLLDGYWWEVYPAGFAIMLTVIAFNLVADALAASLDARQRAG
ncbi:MAG TPA: ABC transporter permease [Streptosporangiaceae bacterium]|nr:ABC transporter permease [Streptosporangiaceae bacterium]